MFNESHQEFFLRLQHLFIVGFHQIHVGRRREIVVSFVRSIEPLGHFDDTLMDGDAAQRETRPKFTIVEIRRENSATRRVVRTRR